MEGASVPVAFGVGAGVTSSGAVTASLPFKAALEEQASKLGFSMVGVAPPESEHVAFYRKWLDEGYHGEMSYLARPDAVARRGSPTETLARARSVIVVAHEYYQRDSPDVLDDPSLGIIARYGRGADYHRVVKKKLMTLARWLDAELGGVEARAYVDTGPILERELARRAGLGWFGRNTMLIHPRRGSFFFLGVLLVDADLEPDPPFEADHCGSCRACLDACPTGALLGRDDDGAPVMDARRCISYLTIELRGSIPVGLRPFVGNRIYGCDICQEVCPFNQRFAEESREPRYAARGPGERPVGMEPIPGEEVPAGSKLPGTDAPELTSLMRMTRGEWSAYTRGSAIRRAGYEGFKRNVAVAVGNWLATLDGGTDEEAESASVREAIGLLEAALDEESEVIREHAEWALAQLARG